MASMKSSLRDKAMRIKCLKIQTDHCKWLCTWYHVVESPGGGISSSVLSVFFTDNCYKLLKSLHLIG